MSEGRPQRHRQPGRGRRRGGKSAGRREIRDRRRSIRRRSREGARDAAKPTGDSLASLVADAPEGGVVRVPGGRVYREELRLDKPLTLVFGEGAEIRGSDVWSGWALVDGRYRSEKRLPDFGPGRLPPDHKREKMEERALWREQVFLDGEPLEQVARDPGPGQFCLDARRRVVLGDDPGEAGGAGVVEVTVRGRWVGGSAPGVKIRGLRARHSYNDGIKNDRNDRWVVEGCDLALAHASNLALAKGRGLRVLDCRVHHGGMQGMSLNDAHDAVVERVELYENNTEGYDPGWASAGIKCAGGRNVTLTGLDAHHNRCTGVWVDVEAEGYEIRDCRSHHNERHGFRFEVSRGAKMRRLYSHHNARAGLSCATSSDVSMEGCVVAFNGDGIVVVNGRRGKESQAAYYDLIERVVARDNVVVQGESGLALAFHKAWEGGNVYDPAAGNGAASNRYWFPGGAATESRERKRFKWETRMHSLAALNRTPAGYDRAPSRYLTDEERDEILLACGIPIEDAPTA